MDISMDIHRKPVDMDMDMDMDGKFHIHGKPVHSGVCAVERRWYRIVTADARFFLSLLLPRKQERST